MGLLDWFSGDDDKKRKASEEMRAAAAAPMQPQKPPPNPLASTLVATVNGVPVRQYPQPLEPVSYPTQQDVEDARTYQQKYGDPNLQPIGGINPDDERQSYRLPPGGQVALVSSKDAPAALDNEKSGLLAVPKTPVDKATADKLMAEQLLARQGPLQYLGFDRDKLTATPETPQNKGGYLTIGDRQLLGLYHPQEDRMWTETRGTEAQGGATHESTHRAFALMRQKGMPTPSHDDEEIMVRALQLKHYGRIEGSDTNPQIAEARKRMKDPAYMAKLDAYEKRANEMIAQRLLERGPM